MTEQTTEVRTYSEEEVVAHVSNYYDFKTSRLRGRGITAYEGDRDYNKVLGYPDEIEIEDYVARYERQDIAARIVDLPAEDSWRKPPAITENGNKDTEFVKKWQELVKRKRIWSVLNRADRLSGIGRFGIILFGLRGDDDLSKPTRDLDDPDKKGKYTNISDLLYLNPLSEQFVEIAETEKSVTSSRYGKPTYYNVRLEEDSAAVKVHHSRVLHLADNRLSSEVFGIPRLQGPFNLLCDLIKFVGGGAETVWLNQRPGTLITNRNGALLDQSDEAIASREEEVMRYLHDPARFLMMNDTDARQIGASQGVDPTGLFNIVIGLISARTGIPQRKLLGSAQGQLASAEWDTKQWSDTIAHRQKTYVVPDVLIPFIGMCQRLGFLPRVQYNVGEKGPDGEWQCPSLVTMSPLEEAGIVTAKATAIKTLENSLTGKLPVSEAEVRELLGYPPRQLDTRVNMLETVMANEAAGSIAAQQLAEYALWVVRDE